MFMFSVPCVILQCQDWSFKKHKLIELCSLQSIESGEEKVIMSDYHSQNSYSDKIANIFKDEINEFLNRLQITDNLKIDKSWFEVAKMGMHHPVHNHGAIGYSVVCYIEYNQHLHTPTTFLAPFNNFLNGEHLQFTPNVDEGVIIFFPSVLHHYTMPNTSDVDRKIVSFNLVPE